MSDCSTCAERQGYYMDADTIQRQQERIAELKSLVRDMGREIRSINDGGIPTDCLEFEKRMHELGVVDA